MILNALATSLASAPASTVAVIVPKEPLQHSHLLITSAFNAVTAEACVDGWV